MYISATLFNYHHKLVTILAEFIEISIYLELQTVSHQLEQEILRCDVINQSCCDYIHNGIQLHMGVSISLPTPTPPPPPPTTQNTR